MLSLPSFPSHLSLPPFVIIPSHISGLSFTSWVITLRAQWNGSCFCLTPCHANYLPGSCLLKSGAKKGKERSTCGLSRTGSKRSPTAFNLNAKALQCKPGHHITLATQVEFTVNCNPYAFHTILKQKTLEIVLVSCRMSAILSHVVFSSQREKEWTELKSPGKDLKTGPIRRDRWNSEQKMANSRANPIKRL